jgi:hypothetical protein
MSFTRRPYTGSCHCGRIRYVVYIKTPTTPTAQPAEPADATEKPPLPTGPAAYHEATGQTVYRCNCTTCTKLSFFHLRLADAPGDFYVLAPRGADGAASPFASSSSSSSSGGGGGGGGGPWGVYHCGPRKVNDWVFCKTCGVRPFGCRGAWTVRGPGEDGVPEEVRREAEAAAAAAGGDSGEGSGGGGPVAVWSPRREGWLEGRGMGSYLSVNMTSVDARQEGFDMRDFSRFKWIGYFELLDDSRQYADEPFEGGMF